MSCSRAVLPVSDTNSCVTESQSLVSHWTLVTWPGAHRNGGQFKQFVSAVSKIFPAFTIIYQEHSLAEEEHRQAHHHPGGQAGETECMRIRRDSQVLTGRHCVKERRRVSLYTSLLKLQREEGETPRQEHNLYSFNVWLSFSSYGQYLVTASFRQVCRWTCQTERNFIRISGQFARRLHTVSSVSDVTSFTHEGKSVFKDSIAVG